MIRAVLDPGVLVSALLSPAGTPAELLRRWLAGAFELVVSEHLLMELGTVLSRPKFRGLIDDDQAVAFLGLLRTLGELVEDETSPVRVTRDPNDDYLVALARNSDAAVLVSGDKDLTSLSGATPPVLTPAQFLSALDAAG